MTNKLTKQITITKELCNNKNELSIPNTIGIFMELATEHGAELGVGMNRLAEKGCIWIVSKTKAHFSDSAPLDSIINASTWPTEAGRIRCNRYYTIYANEREIACGKSEWAIIEAETGRPQKLENLYPNEIELLKDTVCDEPFARLSNDFDDSEILAEYTVAPTDIDANHHMNNVKYIKAVLEALENTGNTVNITDIEVAYKAQCYEGERLIFKIKEQESCKEIGVIKADGQTACVILIS